MCRSRSDRRPEKAATCCPPLLSRRGGILGGSNMQPDLSTADHRDPCTASCTMRLVVGEQRVTQQPRRFAGRSSESGSRGGPAGAGLIGKVATKPEGVNSVGARGAEGFWGQIELLPTFDDVLARPRLAFSITRLSTRSRPHDRFSRSMHDFVVQDRFRVWLLRISR
jgi:hypothetical protein